MKKVLLYVLILCTIQSYAQISIEITNTTPICTNESSVVLNIKVVVDWENYTYEYGSLRVANGDNLGECDQTFFSENNTFSIEIPESCLSGKYLIDVYDVKICKGDDCILENFCIEYIYITFDSENPSLPTNLGVENVTPTSFNLTWGGSTDNHGVEGYEIYKNNVLVGSTSSLSYNVVDLDYCTSYTMSVRAYDCAGNLSEEVSDVFSTIAHTELTFYEDMTSQITVTKQASERINLTDGFQFTALDNTYRFHAFISDCNPSPPAISGNEETEFENSNYNEPVIGVHSVSEESNQNDIKYFDEFIRIYPNPTQDLFNVTISGDYNTVTNIEVYNLQGQLIKKKSNNISYENSIDLNGQPQGMYFVKINTVDGQIVKRVVLE